MTHARPARRSRSARAAHVLLALAVSCLLTATGAEETSAAELGNVRVRVVAADSSSEGLARDLQGAMMAAVHRLGGRVASLTADRDPDALARARKGLNENAVKIGQFDQMLRSKHRNLPDTPVGNAPCPFLLKIHYHGPAIHVLHVTDRERIFCHRWPTLGRSGERTCRMHHLVIALQALQFSKSSASRDLCERELSVYTLASNPSTRKYQINIPFELVWKRKGEI